MTQIGLGKKCYVSNQAQKNYHFETRSSHFYLRWIGTFSCLLLQHTHCQPMHRTPPPNVTELLHCMLCSFAHPRKNHFWHYHPLQHSQELLQCSMQPFHRQGAAVTVLLHNQLHCHPGVHALELQKNVLMTELPTR